MTCFGLRVGPAEMPKGQLLRHSTATLLAAVVVIAVLALLRPGALQASAICAGAAIPLAWSYLVDCGNSWNRMGHAQRAAAAGFIVGAGLLGVVLGSLAHITGN